MGIKIYYFPLQFKVIFLSFFSKFILKSNMEDTKSQYHKIINKSKNFEDKNMTMVLHEILRVISLVDQIHIKAQS